MDPQQEQKIKRVLSIVQELEVRKELYAELDRLTLELQAANFTSTTLDGMFIELVDNFAGGKNTCFRPAGVKRFEMTVEDEVKRAAREAKKRAKAGA